MTTLLHPTCRWLMLASLAVTMITNAVFAAPPQQYNNPLRKPAAPTPTRPKKAEPTEKAAPIIQAFGKSDPLPKRTYVPGHVEQVAYKEKATTSNRSVVTERKIIQDVPVPEPLDVGGEVLNELSDCTSCGAGGCGIGGCSTGGCSTGACTSTGCGGCLTCCMLPIPVPVICFDNFELFGGVQGFTGPTNRGETGSFGFHQGINWATALPFAPRGEFGMQLGARFTQSNLSGAEFTTDDRMQTFVTGGIFRRVDWGLQGGVVIDYLSDDWYFKSNLTQLRTEASWKFHSGHELGAWAAIGSNKETSTVALLGQPNTTETWTGTDLYAFFYRRQFDGCGAEGRFFAGFTGKSDGLIGADIHLPLTERWALDSNFTFLVPDEGTGARGHEAEAWNIGITLVWYPGARKAIGRDYNRPLFRVADNGSFMADRE